MTSDELLEHLDYVSKAQGGGLNALCAQAAARIRELEADNRKLADASEGYMVELMRAQDRIRELEAERDEAVTQMIEAKMANKGVADGTHTIVPVEPTETMLIAGLTVLDKSKNPSALFSREVADAYRAMIRAVQPDKPQQGE